MSSIAMISEHTPTQMSESNLQPILWEHGSISPLNWMRNIKSVELERKYAEKYGCVKM